jgi:colanic acid/amylovoran biosynthesis glycosyltransferase
MSGPRGAARPRFAFYSETCFHRTEHFLYDQLCGIREAEPRVIARWGNCLDEFPVRSLFLAEEFRSPVLRLRNAIVRRVVRHEPTPGRLPPYVVGRLVRHLRRNPVDLVYCLFGWNAAQLLDVLDQLDHRVPLVFLAGGSDITSAPALGTEYLARLRRAFARSSLILSGSRFLRDKLLALGAPESKLEVHYIGMDPPALGPSSSPRKGPGFRVLAVSRLSPVKGVLHTIRAFARAAAEVPDATLRIVGDGEQQGECVAMVESLGLRDRVHFRGSLPLAQVFEEMRGADLFVQHNVRTAQGQEESLGGSILEASAHRLPVVVTRSGGVAEAVDDGRTGIIVEPGDEGAMARAIVALAAAPQRRERFGAAGRERVERDFNLHRQNRRLEQLLHRACEEGAT